MIRDEERSPRTTTSTSATRPERKDEDDDDEDDDEEDEEDESHYGRSGDDASRIAAPVVGLTGARTPTAGACALRVGLVGHLRRRRRRERP